MTDRARRLDPASGDTVLVMATGLISSLREPRRRGKQAYARTTSPKSGIFGLGRPRRDDVMLSSFHYHESEPTEALLRLLKDVEPRTRVFEDAASSCVARKCFLGCSIRSSFRKTPARFAWAARRFFDVFYLIKDSMKSGMHHPTHVVDSHADRQHSRGERKNSSDSVAQPCSPFGSPVPRPCSAKPRCASERDRLSGYRREMGLPGMEAAANWPQKPRHLWASKTTRPKTVPPAMVGLLRMKAEWWAPKLPQKKLSCRAKRVWWIGIPNLTFSTHLSIIQRV